MITYAGVEDIAAWFDVAPQTVSKWLLRYDDTPTPDARIGRVPGWLPDRETEWRSWEGSRPGQGARTRT